MTTLSWLIDDRHPSLARNLIVIVGSVLLMNGIIFALHWNDVRESSIQPSGVIPAPPGWVVGAVWIFLFASMAFSRWLVTAVPHARRIMTILIVNCWVYPLYALAPGNELVGLLGNLVTIGLAAWSYSKVRRVNAAAAISPILVSAWVAFASLTIFDDLGWLTLHR